MNFFPPIPIGTYVKFTEVVAAPAHSKNTIQVIVDVAVDGPCSYEYATNHMAWIPHDELVVIKQADYKSMRILANGDIA